MKRINTTCPVLAIALCVQAFFLVHDYRPASAEHFEWIAQDPAFQDGGTIDNPGDAAAWHFADVGTLQTWGARPPGTALHGWVTQAVANWSAAVPPLQWVEYAPDPLVTFRALPNGCMFNVPGCIEWTNDLYLAYEDVNLVHRFRITLNTSRTFTNNSEVSLFAHEIGHVMGLDERYLHQPYHPFGCAGEHTLMDAMAPDVFGRLVPCDGLYGPAPMDLTRVTASYAEGWTDEFTGVNIGPGGLGPESLWTWKDFAWAERLHCSGLVQWNGGDLRVVGSLCTVNEIGAWVGIEDRVIGMVHNRVNYDNPPGYAPPDWYSICSAPYFSAFGLFSEWRCALNYDIWVYLD